MSGLETGASLSCPGPMTPVGYRGDCHLLPTRRSAALGSNRVCIQPQALIFGRCRRCGQSCLPDACLCQSGGLLLVCAPGSGPRGEEGSKSGEHLNGILLANLRAATAASHALILLLPKGVKPEDGQGEPSPPRRGPSSPSPGLRARRVVPLPWPSACPCGACAQLLCLPFVWNGEKNGMASEEGGGTLAFVEHLTLFLHLQMCDLSGFSGQPETRPRPVFLSPL